MGNVCCSSKNDLPQPKNNEEVSRIKGALDKNSCNSIFRSLPRRETTNLDSFKNIIKQKTNGLSDKEKAYVLFLWVCDNISYDVDAYFAGRDVQCEPEDVFRNGITVCSGYARLYQNIGQYIGLDIQCVNCYSKGVGYEPGDNLTSTNHEYNIIKLDNKYYPIDCTWGSGNIEKKRFKKKLNEFYFLANPELLINTHFPANDMWQLTKRKYTLQEFLNWPQVKETFYSYGFNRYLPSQGLIELNSNAQKFTIWGDNISQNNANCNVYLLQGNTYYEQANATKIDFYRDRIEFNCIFNKKGRYKVELFSNNDKGETTYDIMTYIVNVHNDNSYELNYPRSFAGASDVQIIEPEYDNIRSGQNVKFKFKTDSPEIDTLIIIDGQWNYLNKDPNGYFEKDITIQSRPGTDLVVGKRKENNDLKCSYLYSYRVK